MGELLGNKPLVEALCQFNFSSANTQDGLLGENFYEMVKVEFPERAISKVLFKFPIQGIISPIDQVELHQFKRFDELAAVQINSDLLVINLRDYKNWEDFKSLILKMYSNYCGVRNISNLESVSLRYINHIDTPNEEKVEIEDFLTVFPIFPTPIDKDLNGFSQVYSFTYPELMARLTHRTGIVINSEGGVRLLLDLDIISSWVEPFRELSNLTSWLDQAHDHIETAFIASLNPEYYESLRGQRYVTDNK